jgi:hypothetical protein
MSTLMVGTWQVQENNQYAEYNNRGNAVVWLKAEMHLYLTLKLLAPTY